METGFSSQLLELALQEGGLGWVAGRRRGSTSSSTCRSVRAQGRLGRAHRIRMDPARALRRAQPSQVRRALPCVRLGTPWPPSSRAPSGRRVRHRRVCCAGAVDPLAPRAVWSAVPLGHTRGWRWRRIHGWGWGGRCGLSARPCVGRACPPPDLITRPAGHFAVASLARSRALPNSRAARAVAGGDQFGVAGEGLGRAQPASRLAWLVTRQRHGRRGRRRWDMTRRPLRRGPYLTVASRDNPQLPAMKEIALAAPMRARAD